MSKALRKVLSVVLVAVMMLTAAPLSGFAGLGLLDCFGLNTKASAVEHSGTCGDNIKWSFNEDSNVLLISGSGSIPDYPASSSAPWSGFKKTVLSVIIGDEITRVGDNSFKSFEKLRDIKIGKNVNSIGDYAFSFCDSLRSVSIPDSVVELGEYAIAFCTQLTGVVLGNNLSKIDHYAFCQDKSLKHIILPQSLEYIGDGAFMNCDSFKKVTIPSTVNHIGTCAFDFCGITDIYYVGNRDQWLNIERETFAAGSAKIHYNSSYNNSENLDCLKLNIDSCSTDKNSCPWIWVAQYPAGYGEEDIVWSSSNETVAIVTNSGTIQPVGYGKTYITASTSDGLYSDSCEVTVNGCGVDSELYNLCEETYRFENYVDSDSEIGHCFGMTMTSSGYYLGILDVSNIGISNSNELYTLPCNQVVKRPICYYQDKQGSYAKKAIVAGGSWYKNNTFWNYVFDVDPYNVEKDWKEVIDYVKTHKYDNTGELGVAIRKKDAYGHSVNFLRYENVDGQDRIYVYDNEFPTIETYLCKEADGKIYQKPYSNFEGAIDCIGLRDVRKYFSVVSKFKASRAFYASAKAIKIVDAYAYPMEMGLSTDEYLMYEIPEGVDEIKIIPLVENATFTYMGEEYQFGEITEETYGLFTLSSDEEMKTDDVNLEIINDKSKKVNSVTIDNTSMNYKSSTTLAPLIDVDAGVEYTVEYFSSDPSVATVDENGKVTATGTGSAEITVTVTDKNGNTVSDTCEVTVEYSWLQWIIVIVLFGWIWY